MRRADAAKGVQAGLGTIMLVCAMLLASLWVVVSLSVATLSRTIAERTEQDAYTAAAVFSEQASRVIQSIDETLRSAAYQLSRQPSSDMLRELVSRGALVVEPMVQIAFVDAEGRTIGTQAGPVPDRTSVADREHIRVQLDGKTKGLFVGKPVIGRVSGKWSIQLTRPILGADGGVTGVVVGSLDPLYFERFAARTHPSTEMLLRLIGSDGVLRAQSTGTEAALAQGQDLTSVIAPLGPDAKGLTVQSGDDGSLSLIRRFERVQGFPLVATAEVSQPALWSNPTVHNVLLLGLAGSIATLVLGGLLWRYARQLQRANALAFASERRLVDAIDALPDGITIYDQQNRLAVFNRSFADLFARVGVTVRVGQSYRELVEPQRGKLLFQHDGQSIAEAALALYATARGAVEYSTVDGRTYRLSHHRTTSGDTVGIRTDITEMKERERQLVESGQKLEALAREARAANEAKSAFVATMSHEIRTPLNAIVGFSRILRESAGEGEQAEYARLVAESAEHLGRLVNDVLDFSRLEAGYLNLHEEPFDLRAKLSVVESVGRMLIGQKPVRLSTEVSDEVPDRVVGDAMRVEQILLNLVGNAAKFTDSGEVTVRVRVLDRTEDRARLRFEVEDTGIGMTADDQKVIFDVFRQLRSGRQKTAHGTGLGLAITRQLVELMKGRVSVRSEPGKGSVFGLEIPFGIAPAAPKAVEEPVAEDAPIPPLRVLVAEDVASSRMLITVLLETRGHKVVAVEDGLQALRAAEAEDFDLMLLDVQMPNMEGPDAAAAIRLLPGPKSRTPIYALTAQVLESDRQRAIAKGMDGVLTKPLQKEAVVRVLQIAARRRAEAEAAGTA